MKRYTEGPEPETKPTTCKHQRDAKSNPSTKKATHLNKQSFKVFILLQLPGFSKQKHKKSRFPTGLGSSFHLFNQNGALLGLSPNTKNASSLGFGGPSLDQVLDLSKESSFGELALLYRAPRAATVKALSSARLFVVPRQDGGDGSMGKNMEKKTECFGKKSLK